MPPDSVQIVAATNRLLVESARVLFIEYAQSIAHLASGSLNQQRFTSELASLPGYYAPPRGTILIAAHADTPNHPFACAALRPLDAVDPSVPPTVGEVKRMYVRPAHRRTGTGRALLDALLAHARTAGYTTLKLDTSPEMTNAIALYTAAGFTPCDRYNADPDPNTLYFQLMLAPPTHSDTTLNV
jgi:GNAT superfamily N-acetyltransferase